MTKPLWVKGEHGPAVALEDGAGKIYHVYHVSYRTHAFFLVYDPDWKFGLVSAADLKNASPLFVRIGEVSRIKGFLWDEPAYRSLCVDLGFDPDRGRPVYEPEDADIVLRLREAAKDARSEGMRLDEITFGLLELLRTNERPQFRTYERCQEILGHWTFRQPKTLFEEAFERIDVSRIGSSTSIFREITFLPSWEGTGFTSTIELWGWECEHDGWSQLYRDLRGVALRPVDGDLMTNVAVQRLADQGVIFLSPDEARAYMDGEGAYWSGRQGFAIYPEELAPRQLTSREKFTWRFQRPETPLFDDFRSRSGSNAA